MLSAYAKAGVSHPGLFEKVADHIAAADNLHQFKPREFSNVLLCLLFHCSIILKLDSNRN